MNSPTRKKIDSKRKHTMLTVGILDIACSAVWAKIADLSIAEGKKAEGVLEVVVAGAYAFLGYKHIKSSRK